MVLMKKNTSLILALLMLVAMMTGCGKNEVELKFSEFQTMRSFGDLSDEVIEDIKKEEGVREVRKNDDGSATIVMDEGQHKILLDGLKKELDGLIEYTSTASDFIFVDSIEVGDDYSKMDIFVDKGELEIFKTKNKNEGGDNILDALSFSLGSVVSTYKGYAGTGEDVEINFIDSKSKEELESIDFPQHFIDMMKEKEGTEEAK